MSRAAAEAALLQQLAAGACARPRALLGPHREAAGWLVRGWHPDAVAAELRAGDRVVPMAAESDGLFTARLAEAELPPYSLRFEFADGNAWQHRDPYRFGLALDAADVDALAAGRHARLWKLLGARPQRRGGVDGTRFLVWAPRAAAVALVGDFCAWDGRLLPMQKLAAGVFGLFVPEVGPGALYQFEVRSASGAAWAKSDPVGRAMEPPPRCASRVVRPRFGFADGAWMSQRARIDPRRAPLAIYEVHLGSWRRDGDRRLSYRELAPLLVEHVRALGFTHLQLLPLAEHAYYPSWGYQVTGHYAVTGRYGTPDDLRWFVDYCHRHDVGVILDWVPAHFPKDEFGLRCFDGQRLYERQGEHPSWGTLRFDFSRPEVRAFLISNALYWLREFHFDGLRVDAVSWVVYADYLEREPPWTRDPHGIGFLQELHRAVEREAPAAITIAEEATDFPGVTAPVKDGGLGFTFKWNMGWMHDTLRYVRTPFDQRAAHHDWLTFAFSYQQNEHYVDALSHDEVVHLKRPLLLKMPGEEWQQRAGLRLLLAAQVLRPGKSLWFMGTELAPVTEWDHDRALDWSRGETAEGRALHAYVGALLRLYRRSPCLWRRDDGPDGFAWIAGDDRENGVLAFVRRDGDAHLVVVLHWGDEPCEGYSVGVPAAGTYRQVLCSEATRFGGAVVDRGGTLRTAAEPSSGWRQSLLVDLPPLAALVLAPARIGAVQSPPAGSVPAADSHAVRAGGGRR